MGERNRRVGGRMKGRVAVEGGEEGRRGIGVEWQSSRGLSNGRSDLEGADLSKESNDHCVTQTTAPLPQKLPENRFILLHRVHSTDLFISETTKELLHTAP